MMKKANNPTKLQHYLISLSTGKGIIVHAYLITANEEDRNRAAEVLLAETEKRVGDVLVPIVLSTLLNLDSGVELVENHIKQRYPDIKQTLATMKDYHFSIFAEDPATSQELMDLH